MKKGELKNRLRRRTADKLYDFARSTGRVPAHPPRVETPTPALDGTRRNRRPPAKLRSGRTPGHALEESDLVLVTAIECDPVTNLRFSNRNSLPTSFSSPRRPRPGAERRNRSAAVSWKDRIQIGC